MERVSFLLEDTGKRISCLLNPQENGLTIERSSGVGRESDGSLVNSDLSDNPVVSRNRGDTRLTLELLFDVFLPGSNVRSGDVRALTGPFWHLSEYVVRGSQRSELPRVRFIWGKSWNFPIIVEAVSERYERFTAAGVPQRSWLSMRLLRVSAENNQVEPPRAYDPQSLPTPELLARGGPDWRSHEVTGREALWQIAARYYGDASLWRLLAYANNLNNPLLLWPGQRLRIPPLYLLRRPQ